MPTKAERHQRTKLLEANPPVQFVTARDSFVLPIEDHQLIVEMIIRSRIFSKRDATKNEILRIALRELSKMSDSEIGNLVNKIPKVPRGRPFNQT